VAQDSIERLGSELRAEADGADFSGLAEPAITRGSRPPLIGRLRTRAAAIVAAVLVTFGGLSGVAIAANGAAPGDALYGIDRALEAVGIGNGQSTERLHEVKALVDRGHPDRAVQHATDLVEDDSGAQEALLAAAERIGGFDRNTTHEGVATLLTYLSENVGSVDGPTVADLARSIRGNEPSGPPEGVTPGPPEGVTPGPPGTVIPGPPEGVFPGPPGAVIPGPPDPVIPLSESVIPGESLVTTP